MNLWMCIFIFIFFMSCCLSVHWNFVWNSAKAEPRIQPIQETWQKLHHVEAVNYALKYQHLNAVSKIINSLNAKYILNIFKLGTWLFHLPNKRMKLNVQSWRGNLQSVPSPDMRPISLQLLLCEGRHYNKLFHVYVFDIMD